ncbi:hypothetical protein ACOMHN_021723 [Nucella lapillus]
MEGLWVRAWSGSDMEATFWSSGQPDNGDRDGENCLEMHEGSFLWNDEVFHHQKNFICQMRRHRDRGDSG